MRMNNRFCRMGKAVLGACLLLSMSGLAYSCSDDYDLDDKKPNFLGGSIYDELKSLGNFKTTIRLIDDLNYTDVMSKTGSKTLFVANDEAYDAFFKNNPWGVKSYEGLTMAQKRILFNGAQLNNAYVLEMMSNCENGEKNLCLRQVSSAAATDSVPFWRWDQLPVNYSEDQKEAKYWKRHANPNKGGIYMANDATMPLLTHFLEGQMNEKGIKHSDVSFILFGNNTWPEDENRSYVYDARVAKQDVVCLNGYFHVLDKVMVPPGNMAEVIRTNADTQIFSHILDRFSAPYYNATLTENFKALYNVNVDSVFEKRYFAVNTRSGRFNVDPENLVNNDMPLLNFDPGWNAYRSSDTEQKEKDMGAMFVPNDEALAKYFLPGGGGRVLIERYATKPNTRENLIYNLDQIPLDVIQALVNNLMKSSFNESVPSKYLTIMNDARDQMFTAQDYPTEESYKSNFTKSLLANNGVVYVMNKVITPADYASVIAPALYNEDAEVMRTVVRADDSFIQGNSYNNAPLKQYFSTYLKAMQSNFSFFIPSDKGFAEYGYVDPASLATGNANRYLVYKWIPASVGSGKGGKRIGVFAQAYKYDLATGKAVGNIDNQKSSKAEQLLDLPAGRVKQQLLVEMVNQHIIVHNENEANGVKSNQKYFLSRVGAPVVIKSSNRGVGMEVSGGFQEQFSATPCKVLEEFDQTAATNGYGNGMVYLLDRPLQSTTNSTYHTIASNANYSKFLSLCEGVSDALLEKAGFKDSILAAGGEAKTIAAEWDKVAAKYYVFLRGEKAAIKYNAAKNDKLVRFFNNYRYTVYVPTNTAVDAELAKGLKTWDEIDAYLTANLQTVPALAADKSNQAAVDAAKAANSAVKVKAQAMITTLVNFLKYHFQDETLFVDDVPTRTAEYMTSCVDEVKKVYLGLKVKQSSNSLKITDLAGNEVEVDNSHCNMLVRDANHNSLDAPTYIQSSSYAVVHQINKALVFDKSLSSSYTRAWASPKKAKAFVAKFRIKE